VVFGIETNLINEEWLGNVELKMKNVV